MSTEVKNVLNTISNLLPMSHKQVFNSVNYYHFERVINLILKYARPGARVLDVGCGSGLMGVGLKMLGFDVALINEEYGHRMTLEAGRYKLVEENKIPIYVMDASIEKFPFDDESFDIVTILGVIEHFHGTPRFCLEEIHRILARNGKLIIGTPNSVNLRKRLVALLGRSNYPNIHDFFYSDYPYRSHVREYTMKELELICRWSGFKVTEKIYANEFYQYHTVIEDGQQMYKPGFKLQSIKQVPIVGFRLISTLLRTTRDNLRIVVEKA